MREKIAILVIHGIGEQYKKPLETLDAFVRPLAQAYSELLKQPVKLNHKIEWINGWGESCLSLMPETEQYHQIDTYEYYWSHLTQRRIKAPEVMKWIVAVSQGAKAYYQRRGKSINLEAGRNEALFRKDGEFDHYKYLIRMLSLGGWLRWIYPVILRLMDAMPLLKAYWKIIGYFFSLLSPLVARVLASHVGDITLYCATDEKSEYYPVRKAILDGAVEKIQWLATNGGYDKLILCGHSLGSVIVYDALDRLNLRMSQDANLRQKASCFGGIVTFGSPLDKIAFFFDERINQQKQPLRYAMVSHLHGFRRVNMDNALPTTLGWHLGSMPWINFWSPKDMVSGHLDVYKNVMNIRMDFADKFLDQPLSNLRQFIFSHLLYWEWPGMYEKILQNLVFPTPARGN